MHNDIKEIERRNRPSSIVIIDDNALLWFMTAAPLS
jgi:hypothetical protein